MNELRIRRVLGVIDTGSVVRWGRRRAEAPVPVPQDTGQSDPVRACTLVAAGLRSPAAAFFEQTRLW